MEEKHNPTAEKLRQSAKQLFWRYGYSNISVRKIANDAGVDVALINRYFSSKLGLFEATLTDLKFPNFPQTEGGIKEFFLEFYSHRSLNQNEVSAFHLLLSCAQDEIVGEKVRAIYDEGIHKKLAIILKSEARAALFSAGILGFSFAGKTLMLKGIPDYHASEYRDVFGQFLEQILKVNPTENVCENK